MIYPWQQSQWQRLTGLVNSGCLPHALLLTGKAGLGKSEFARNFAQSLLCSQPDSNGYACGDCPSCHLMKAATHPDYYFLQPTAAENSKSKRPVTAIRIDEIRALCADLFKTSQYGGYRIAIIENADKMNTAASNSLLKTLEEPGANVLIILVSAHPDRLPATIRSRSQQLRFHEPENSDAISWLQQTLSEEVDREVLTQSLKRAYGSPLLAIKQVENGDFYQLIDEAMMIKTGSRSRVNVPEISAKLLNYDKNHVLEAMLSWVSDVIRFQCGSVSGQDDGQIINTRCAQQMKAISGNINAHRLYWFYDQILEKISYSSIATNEQLMWENLLLSWKHL